jgi:hypothetical protein
MRSRNAERRDRSQQARGPLGVPLACADDGIDLQAVPMDAHISGCAAHWERLARQRRCWAQLSWPPGNQRLPV